MATLSVPSYVIPGTYLENLKFLEDKRSIGNVELLFFSFDRNTETLLRGELDEIAAYRSRYSYSVHLPEPPGNDVRRLVELLRPVAERFIVHAPEGGTPELGRWLERARSDFGEVFLVENVAGRAFDQLLDELRDVPVCCDTGHLLLDGIRPALFLDRVEERVGEIHLHGVSDGRDHRPFGASETWFQEIVPFLKRFDGIIHVELFDYAVAEPTIELIECLISGAPQQELL